jgi:hypothetical protein
MVFRSTWTPFACAAAASMLFWSGALRAAVIDRLELFPEAHGETEILVWFAQRVAVRSYNPKESGRLIRIYFQLLESGLGAPSPAREVET